MAIYLAGYLTGKMANQTAMARRPFDTDRVTAFNSDLGYRAVVEGVLVQRRTLWDGSFHAIHGSSGVLTRRIRPPERRGLRNSLPLP